MVTPIRSAKSTVSFIDHYCHAYRTLFEDVRNFEYFKYLHLGMISEIPRKSLPAIAKISGLKDSQGLHHFLKDANWSVSELRETRLWLTKMFIGDREIILCIDETGDKKKGKKTDYVARQYIGNLGKIENGIVSVNAYAVVNGITYPLLFKIFKPSKQLKKGDVYQTKPKLAIEIIKELKKWGFKIKLVLADSLYGESGDVIRTIKGFSLNYIVAIRSNHGVLMIPGDKKRYNSWRPYQQNLSKHKAETRYIREIVFGKRRGVRYYQISKRNVPDPSGEESWYVMTNLPGNIRTISLKIGPLYSLRNWIEYGFKQVKNELGWADYRLTNFDSIARWWEIIFSAYLLVSIQANYFQLETVKSETKCPQTNNHKEKHLEKASFLPLDNHKKIIDLNLFSFSRHQNWESGTTWKSALNNLRLIIQPYIFYCLIQPWLKIKKIPGMAECFQKLIAFINSFQGFSTISIFSEYQMPPEHNPYLIAIAS